MKMTKTMWHVTLSLMLMTLLGFTVAAYGQYGSRSKTRATSFPPSDPVMRVTVEGVHAALNGSGSSRDRAYVLRVRKAVNQDGRTLTGLKGVSLRYSDTRKSRDLINKVARGERLVITGRLHAATRVLDVDSYKRVEIPERVHRRSTSRRRGSGTK